MSGTFVATGDGMYVGVVQRSLEPLAGSVAQPAAAEVPPLHLPGQHFAAALVCGACGAIGLVAIAPELSRLSFQPRTVAVVHLFTLGWIMLSIFGALCQFLPVAVQRSLRWPALAHVSFGLQVVGVASLVSGLVIGNRPVFYVGASALSGAFVAFAVNLGATLASVRERSLTFWALAGATVFLVVTPIYGVVLALNLNNGMLGAQRFHMVAVHAHVAIIGIVLLVMVGVGQRLLPTFLLSHGGSERPGFIAVVLLFASASILALPLGVSAAIPVAAALASSGVIAFLVQALIFFRHRKRRAIDPGMRIAAAGMLGLAVSVLLAPFALTRGLTDLTLLTTYFVVLLGAISLFIAGHYYKIVPFLVWYHRFGPLVGTRKVPKVAELFSERVALVNGGLLVVGWLGLAVGTYLGAPRVAQAAALSFAAGMMVELVVMARVARRRPA